MLRDTLTLVGGAGDRTSILVVTSQSALPSEPHGAQETHLHRNINRTEEMSDTHPSCLLEGGVCVMTDVGEGSVGFSESNPMWRGSEPGRTMVGVGAELGAGFGGSISC